MTKLNVVNNESWYKEGLCFECTGCGKCCEGSPGYVWIDDKEALEISEHLGISLDQFYRTYTRMVGKRRSLIELKKKNYACVFLDEGKCQIYHKRPKQCRTYPFWPKVLESKKSWREEAKYCEGINSDKRLRSFAEIKEILDNKQDA